RRRFSREFKQEVVRLVKDQGISIAKATKHLDLHDNVLHKWVRTYDADPAHAFPGPGPLMPELTEMLVLRNEIRKLKPARDILNKAAKYFASNPN
ncbi:MAG: transposase, partial [Halioglobus sp.]